MSSLDINQHASGLQVSVRLFTWVSIALIAAVATVLHLSVPVNHDASWVITSSGWLLDGARFGRDVIDVNPPLIWWMTMPAVLMSRWTGIDQATVFQLCILAAGLASLALCSRLFLLLKVHAAALVCMAFAFLVFPGYEFGQRGHLVLVLASPYVLLCAARAQRLSIPVYVPVIAGVAAALAFCLKPYFAMIPAGLMLLLIVQCRSFKAAFSLENVAAAAVCIAYVAAVMWFAPDYIDRVVPDAMVSYNAYAAAPWPVARTFLIYLLPVCFALLLVARNLAGTRSASAAQYMAVAAAGAAIAAIMQQKGWFYHILPAVGFMAIAAASGLGRNGDSRALSPEKIIAVILIAFSLTRPVQALLQDISTNGRNYAVTKALSAEFSSAPKPATVFAFITSPRNVHAAVVDAGAEWAGQACCIHLLPAHIRDVRAGITAGAWAAKRRELAEGQIQSILQRLNSAPPQVIVVDGNAHKLAFGKGSFDYLEWLQGRPDFDRLWQRYKETSRIGHFRVFRNKTQP